MPGPRTRAFFFAAAPAVAVAFALPEAAAAFQLSPDSPASPNADDAATAWWVMFVLATVIALAGIGGLIVSLRGRGVSVERRTRGTGAVQAKVAGALTLLATAVFIFGVVVTESSREVEATGSDGLQTAQRNLGLPESSEPLEIKVDGQQWLWRYEYPDGTFSYYEMVVPVETAVVLEIGSTDLHHRWWVPALGGQFDAVAGTTNRTWFKADEVGVYEGRSTEFSGPGYASMQSRVRVVEPAEYEAWLEQQAAEIAAAQAAVAGSPPAPPEAGTEAP